MFLTVFRRTDDVEEPQMIAPSPEAIPRLKKFVTKPVVIKNRNTGPNVGQKNNAEPSTSGNTLIYLMVR